jgi:Na+/melibiose symporter-like transporter
MGAIPNTLKTSAIASFLLLYYDRVLGMPAVRASVALFFALLIDAISGPLVGSYSDHYRSKSGRRNLLMSVCTGYMLYICYRRHRLQPTFTANAV